MHTHTNTAAAAAASRAHHAEQASVQCARYQSESNGLTGWHSMTLAVHA